MWAVSQGYNLYRVHVLEFTPCGDNLERIVLSRPTSDENGYILARMTVYARATL